MKEDPNDSARAIDQLFQQRYPKLMEFEASFPMQIITGELTDPIPQRIIGTRHTADASGETVAAVQQAVAATVLELAGRYVSSGNTPADVEIAP